jgi:peroxiredoxin
VTAPVIRRRAAGVLAGVVLLAAACGSAKRKDDDEIPVVNEPDQGTPANAEPRPLEAGKMAPEFALPDAAGRTHTLSELRVTGAVVVVFYQGSWCGTCREQLKRFQDKSGDFEKMTARLVAISADPPDKSKRLAETLAITYPLLSDTELRAAGGFGVTQSVGGLSLAAVFVIDREGTVRWSQVGETVPIDQALDAARALAPPRDAGP